MCIRDRETAIEDSIAYWEDQSVIENTAYYYYITAYDENGNESDPSDTVGYTLIDKVLPLSPANRDTITSTPKFIWELGSNTIQYYRIRVCDDANAVFWISSSIPFSDTSKVYNFDQRARPLTPGRYRWRIDATGVLSPASGSESHWMEFTYNP